MNNTGWIAAGGAIAGMGAAMFLAKARRKGRYSFRGRTVVITGGSRGLGLVLARHWVKEGAQVALLARNENELRRAEADLTKRGGRVLIIPCDVCDEADVCRAIERVANEFGRIDVLVNNAGVMQVGPFEHARLDDYRESLAVYLFGPLYACTAALPHLAKTRAGRIVNITSIGAKIAVPHLLPYSTGKFALAGFSEGLQSEVRRYGVRVTTVYPGMMRTGSPPNASFRGRHHQEYAWFSICAGLPLFSMSADRAAERIVEACRHGKPRLHLGLPTRPAILFNEMFPRLTAELLAFVNRLLPGPEPMAGQAPRSGWESQSRLAPSLLTRLSDKATVANNERPY